MSARPLISEVGHVSVRVRDLEASEEVATELMGLTVSERSDDELWLSHGTAHHSLHYIRAEVDAVDHVGLVAPDAEALAELRARVEARGLPVLRDQPTGPGVLDGFTFAGPEGEAIEVYSEMTRVEDALGGRGVRPTRFGHVNFSPRRPEDLQGMFTDLLDFRVSDRVGGGAFMRCNVDHHGVGVFPGAGVLHHHAWEVGSIVDLAALADLVDARGGSVLWGPARHGIGRNIATYFQEPSGLVVEYYADMDRIYDDDHHQPGEWEIEGHKWFTLWGPHVPDGFVELGIPFAR